MPSLAVLQKRRAQLVRQFKQQQAVAQRHLEAFIETHNKARDIDARIAVIDRDLNGMIDAKLEAVVEPWTTIEAVTLHED